MKTILYHNPSCSKSCAVQAEMSKLTTDFEIINYLENTPSTAELKNILSLLNMQAFDLIRKNESVFIEQFEGKHLSNNEWIEVMIAHPVLIERPIVIHGNQAAIGRPIERIIDLFQ